MYSKEQIDYVTKLQEEYSKNNRGKIGVFVVPFDFPTNGSSEAVRPTAVADLYMVQVMSTYGLVYSPEQRVWKIDIRDAIIFGTREVLRRKYMAGQNIGGRIVTEYSCEDKGRDRQWSKLIAHITDIVCLDSNNKPIYYFQYWSEDEDAADADHPVVANLEEIRAARAIRNKK